MYANKVCFGHAYYGVESSARYYFGMHAKDLSVPEAALWQQLTPIASYLWALTIGERIGAWTLVGVLLGVAGIVYGSVLGHRPREARSPEAQIAAGIPAEEP
jgi:drug/metabolite transporter (DMT)-like permease